MVRSNKIPFGMKDGQMVGVDAVLSGLACECVCPACHGRLQARKGEIRVHYFAHDQLSDCTSSLETSIHRMAKQIIEEEKRLMLPQLIVAARGVDPRGFKVEETEVVTEAKRQILTKVVLEQGLTDIRPDIVGHHNGKQILIEVCVTHPVGKAKKKKIRDRNLAAIEIDLSGVNYSISESELRELVVNSVKNKKWLSLPSAKDAKQRVRFKLDQRLDVLTREHRKKLQTARSKKVFHEEPTKFVAEKSVLKEKVTLTTSEQHFFCDTCTHLWMVERSKVHDQTKYVKCPECGSAVSTKPSGVLHSKEDHQSP